MRVILFREPHIPTDMLVLKLRHVPHRLCLKPMHRLGLLECDIVDLTLNVAAFDVNRVRIENVLNVKFLGVVLYDGLVHFLIAIIFLILLILWISFHISNITQFPLWS